MQRPFAPPELLRAATDILQRLHLAGHEAYVAGGAVRDYLMGRPQSDLDIATSATPDEVRRLFPKTFAVGESFGVILVRHRGLNFEVATFREESDYADGRHPGSVRFANAQADVARRDFTINGMLYDVARDKVLDWVGGQADVKSRILRTIGDPNLRFAEDKLRMLRALRFAAQLDFQVEDQTLRAIRQHAPELKLVSLERVRQELDKLLAAPAAWRALSLLENSGLWKVMQAWLREESKTFATKSLLPWGEAQGMPWLMAWRQVRNEPRTGNLPAMCALCAVLLDVGAFASPDFQPQHLRQLAHALSSLVRALRGSRPEMAQAEAAATILCHMRGMEELRLADQLRLLRMPEFPWVKALATAHPAFALTPFALLDETVARYKALWHPVPFLSGNDMMSLGIQPGPALGELMRAQETGQLEGTLNTVDDARALVVAHLRATVGDKP